MIKNYFLLFVRNLNRQKLFSAINLLGLTISMASTLLIYLYVRYEFSYDNFHPHAERLYRVNQTFIWAENRTNQFSRTGPGVANALKEELSEVELITSLHTPGDFIVSYTKPSGEVVAFEENKVFAADTNFFKVFNFPLLQGDAASAFRHANTLVMTRSTAQKYFGHENAIGKLVRLGGFNGEAQHTYEVSGVVEDTPSNSTIQFDVLLSMKGFPVDRLHWSWIWTQLETFVLLDEHANIDAVREKLTLIPRKRAEETLQRAMGISYDEYIQSGKKWELFLQPITDLHLPQENVLGSFPDTGNIKIIHSLIGAAIFIVLLSCINFMNLSTAQFTRRIKEASIRKILGHGKKELSISYFLEALSFCLLAMFAALALAQLVLPGFNMITGKQIEMNLFRDPLLVIALPALVVLMSLVSCSYPALFLTTFHPAEALKGKARVGHEGKTFRHGLVIFQFSISIILVLCTAIVYQQLTFMAQKDLGFDKENLLVLHHAEATQHDALANASLNVPGVLDASLCKSAPPYIFGGDTFTAEDASDLKFPLNYTSADERYITTLGIKIVIGRNFSSENPADSNRVLLNESAIRKIGWDLDESVIGKKIYYPNSGSDKVYFEVIGVVADFNYWSIAAVIEPMAIFNIKTNYIIDRNKEFLVVKVQPQNSSSWQKTFASLKSLWKTHAGETPFQYTFVDESFAQTFVSQQQFGNILTVMAVLAIIIAGLGLFGMIIYALEQRTKEIGIRKISGASVYQILLLISRGYTKLIIVAFLIAAPLSYLLMSNWLKDFAYAIKPSWWIFIVTGICTFFMAIMITAYHSVKAALTNPIDVLKEE